MTHCPQQRGTAPSAAEQRAGHGTEQQAARPGRQHRQHAQTPLRPCHLLLGGPGDTSQLCKLSARCVRASISTPPSFHHIQNVKARGTHQHPNAVCVNARVAIAGADATTPRPALDIAAETPMAAVRHHTRATSDTRQGGPHTATHWHPRLRRQRRPESPPTARDEGTSSCSRDAVSRPTRSPVVQCYRS